MLTNVNKDIFLNSDEINLLPIITAEWNNNLFNPPYATVAGKGIKESGIVRSENSDPVFTVSDSNKHPSFETHLIDNDSTNKKKIIYSVYPDTYNYSAYKIVAYAKTNKSDPIILNASAKGAGTQYGSTSVEINNYGWTKIEFIIGGSSSDDTISSFDINYIFNTSNEMLTTSIYYTEPEVYATQYFNYQYNSLWPTDAPFAFFRPGESYVNTGNSNISLPSEFRKINSDILNNLSITPTYAPVSSIIQNPKSFFVTQYHPLMKNILPTDISPYKYFVSDLYDESLEGSSSISAVYENNIITNKIVIKLNTLILNYNVSVYVNGSNTPISTVTTGLSSSDFPNGVIILYYNGSSWSKNKWSTVPSFNSSGQITSYQSINHIRVDVTPGTVNGNFPSGSSKNISAPSYSEDLLRAHIIEVSPRVEVDLSSYVQDVSINKQLDSKSTIVPLSNINADDANITLAGMPIFTGSDPIPLFSNQSSANSSLLSNMLRKNIKFYINWNLLQNSASSQVNNMNQTIPAGVFYSDQWSESDIDSVRVQCFDIVRYLQTLPVPDYVASYKTVFNIISTLLDRAGFTDYDIDSLYTVTNDKSAPLDMSYYYANSQDKTLAAALSELFLAYQIGAYIDEYGIMKFLSLANILNSSSSSAAISINENNIYQSGYQATNIGKIGKISLRYQEPRIKQSLAMQNATDPTQKNSPSFIYTTKNEQVWTSNSLDSVGFNYLANNMSEGDDYFYYNVNDLQDIFHTFDFNSNGYAMIENEIVSFENKEYTISGSGSSTKTVSVKNGLELASEIDDFVKNKTKAQLTLSDGTSRTENLTNITIVPTGKITNVKRGMFGTIPSDHGPLSDLDSKNLLTATVTNSGLVSLGGDSAYAHVYNPYVLNTTNPDTTSPGVQVIECAVPASRKVLIYPSNQEDLGFSTYATKFNIYAEDLFAGGIFFNWQSETSMDGAFFVEFVKSHSSNKDITTYNFETGESTTTPKPIYQYFIIVYQMVGGLQDILAWSDVTAVTNKIIDNFEKVFVKQTNSDVLYEPAADEAFHLKVVHYNSDGSDGEDDGRLIDVFLNNTRITGWLVPDSSTQILSDFWKPTDINKTSAVRKLPKIDEQKTNGYDGIFGAYMSTKPATINTKTYDSETQLVTESTISYNMGEPIVDTAIPGSIRELYATQIPLKDRSTNYWYQTQQFLNGLIQNQNIYGIYKTYCMQTTPSISGINVYDVQYQQVAATNVDILPVQYYQKYYPHIDPPSNDYVQEIIVDEYSLAYSVPINTGFRAKFAIANNSPYLVFIHKDPDDLNTSSTKLVLWTHELVSQSDPAIVEKVLSVNNATEVAQVDSQWIQSRNAANKMISLVAHSIDGFSVDTNLKIFGNPLIQLGDVVSVTYKLAGINSKLFVVQSVKHSFSNGLETELVLNSIGPGIKY